MLAVIMELVFFLYSWKCQNNYRIIPTKGTTQREKEMTNNSLFSPVFVEHSDPNRLLRHYSVVRAKQKHQRNGKKNIMEGEKSQ